MFERLSPTPRGSSGFSSFARGAFSVTFTLPGFRSFRRDELQLTSGFTSQVNVELEVGSLEETVTVTGASPTVDVQNTRTQTVLTRDMIDTLPTGKSLAGYASMTLAATSDGFSFAAFDVGGNKGEASQTGFAVHGGSTNDSHFYQSGMTLSHPSGTGSAQARQFQTNQAAVEEIVLETDGTTAENVAGGVVIQIIPKEGGNSLSMLTQLSGTTSGLQNNNKTDEVRAFGITEGEETRHIYDFALGVGGPIARDKLWFYGAARAWGSSVFAPGRYFNLTPHTLSYTPDLDRRNSYGHRDRDVQARVTWQLTDNQRLAGFTGFQCNGQIYSSAVNNASGENSNRSEVLPAEWQSSCLDVHAVESAALRGGQYRSVFRNHRESPRGRQSPMTFPLKSLRPGSFGVVGPSHRACLA